MQKKVTYTNEEMKAVIIERFFDLTDNFNAAINWPQSYIGGDNGFTRVDKFNKTVVNFEFVVINNSGAVDTDATIAIANDCLDFIKSYFGFKSFTVAYSGGNYGRDTATGTISHQSSSFKVKIAK